LPAPSRLLGLADRAVRPRKRAGRKEDRPNERETSVRVGRRPQRRTLRHRTSSRLAGLSGGQRLFVQLIPLACGRTKDADRFHRSQRPPGTASGRSRASATSSVSFTFSVAYYLSPHICKLYEFLDRRSVRAGTIRFLVASMRRQTTRVFRYDRASRTSVLNINDTDCVRGSGRTSADSSY